MVSITLSRTEEVSTAAYALVLSCGRMSAREEKHNLCGSVFFVLILERCLIVNMMSQSVRSGKTVILVCDEMCKRKEIA